MELVKYLAIVPIVFSLFFFIKGCKGIPLLFGQETEPMTGVALICIEWSKAICLGLLSWMAFQ